MNETPTAPKKKKAPREIHIDSVCNLKELAGFLGMGISTIYEKTVGPTGYKLQYPVIHRTTPRHFLAWASQVAPTTPEEVGAAEQREREKYRLRSAVDTPRAPKLSRGSRTALPRPEKFPAARSAHS